MRKKIILCALVIVVIVIVLIATLSGKNENYQKSYLYELNGLYGLENDEGVKVTEAKYDKIIKIDNVDNMFIAVIDDKYGIINSAGKEVLDIRYDNVFSDGYSYDYSNIGYVLMMKTDDGYKFGYANNKGRVVIDCIYEEVKRVLEYNGENIYLAFKDNGRYGIFKNNKILVKAKYQDIFYNEAIERFIVDKNGKYGVLDIDGKELIKPEHTMFGVDGNEIFFLDNNKTIYYDADGKLLRTIEKE